MQQRLTAPLAAEDAVKLMENALAVIDKPDANAYLSSFADSHGGKTQLQRYELAQLLYGR